MWIFLGLISSFFLGLYDICKKHALNRNAVFPILFLSTLSGFIPLLIVFVLSRISPETMEATLFYVPAAEPMAHLHIFIKALIISVSWTLAYFAMKHLPISIVSPIRASGPVWTLIGALLIFQERPEPLQWAGMAIVFFSYYLFSLLGRKKGIHFHRSRWVLFVFLATFIGTFSSLYDKYLFQQLHYVPMLVQFWFSFYLVVLLGAMTLFLWVPRRSETTAFRFRWTLPLIGLLLVAADLVYYHAVSDPSALIVVLSILRRSSVIVSFGIGSMLFGDVNRRGKAWVLAGVLAGVVLIVLSG